MMNVLLLYPKEYERLYNCTSYKVDDVPFKDRQHVFTGIALIFLFAFFEVLYIPCVFTLYKLTSQSTYKTMFVIVCWGNASMSSTLLAFSRCVGIWKPSLAMILFDGNRTWYWHLIIFGYVLYYSLLNTPLLYTSMETAWIYNPHHGYLEGVDNLYGSMIEIYHDIFVIIVILALYIGFLIVLRKKKTTQKVSAGVLMVKPVHHSDTSERKAHFTQKNILVQVFLIGAINTVTAMLALSLALIGESDANLAPLTFLWTIAHGVHSIIYLILNPTVRRECFKMLHGKFHLLQSNFGSSGQNTKISMIPSKITHSSVNMFHQR